jgi:ribosomal protein S18 acetylase RimI-like enzyme
MITRKKILIKLLEKYSEKKVLLEINNETNLNFSVESKGNYSKIINLIQDSEKVGYCEIGPYNRNKHILYIVHIEITDKKNRKKGYGNMLMQKAIEYAKINNFSGVLLTVNKKNTRALNLYNKLGFKTIEEDQTHNLMQLDL